MIYFTVPEDSVKGRINSDYSMNTIKEVQINIPSAIEATKAEYDMYILKTETLPALSANNINHNYFNGAEAGLRIAMFVYHEYIKINHDKTESFLAYMKATAKADVDRSIAFYNAKIAGDSDTTALNKAMMIAIPQDNFDAIAGQTNFLQWAIVEFPNLREYILAVNSLNYSTFLTEDEPE